MSRGEIPGSFAAQKEEDRFYDELWDFQGSGQGFIQGLLAGTV